MILFFKFSNSPWKINSLLLTLHTLYKWPYICMNLGIFIKGVPFSLTPWPYRMPGESCGSERDNLFVSNCFHAREHSRKEAFPLPVRSRYHWAKKMKEAHEVGTEGLVKLQIYSFSISISTPHIQTLVLGFFSFSHRGILGRKCCLCSASSVHSGGVQS